MRYKRLIPYGTTLLALVLFVMFGLTVGSNLAQRPQGPWVNLEISISPGEAAIGDGFLTTLTLRNEGTDPATVDAVTAGLPAGVIYAGQASGSDVVEEAETSQSELRWTGPFTVPASAELNIRLLVVASGQASPGQYPVSATALSGDGALVSAEVTLTLLSGAVPEPPPAQPSQVERAPVMPSAIMVTKTVEPEVVDPGDTVTYIVTFTNTGSSPVTLDAITDTLPAPLLFVGPAMDSEIGWPTDQDEPEIVWEGAFDVPANDGTLVLRYLIYVPDDTPITSTPYTNEVTARYGSTPVGPAYAQVRMAGAPPPAPANVAASDGAYSDRVRVTWDAVSGATSYEVYRATAADGAKTLLGSTASTSFDDTTAAGSTTHYYWVKACDSSSCSEHSVYDTGYWGGAPPSPPANMAASEGTYGDRVRITWDAVSGATSYEVYRATAADSAKTLLGTATGTSYDDTTAAGGVSYYYWSRACNSLGCSDYSVHVTGYREGYRLYLPVVQYTEEPTTTLPFVDTFAQLSPDWVVFANPDPNQGPYANQWIWDPAPAYAGLYWYDPNAGGHSWDSYALSMYLAPGAQNWGDYQVVTTLRLRDDRLGGIWVRGTYQNGNLGGYYVHLQPRNDYVYLWRFPPGSQTLKADLVDYDHFGPGIDEQQWYHLKVEVRGATIKVWLKPWDDPESAYKLSIDWTDANSTWMQGTVGLSAYKAFTVYNDISVTELP